MSFNVVVLSLVLVLPSFVVAQDCIDYCDYLHGTGWADTPFMSYDVAVNGAYAYVADANESLQIIDIANPDYPVRIGAVNLAGPASGVIVAHGYAYVAAGNAGVTVLALDEPSAPTVVGSITTPASISGLNDTGELILAVGAAGLYVIDASDPKVPILRGSLAFAGAQDAVGAGDLVCVVTDSLHLVDIGDLDAPVVLAALGVPDSPHSVALQGQYAYLACGGAWDGGSLQIVDVSDPEHPTCIGAATGNWAEGIAVVGHRAYLCGLVPSTWRGRFQVFDVADPTTPRLLVATMTPGQPHRMVMSGNLAFVADGGAGLQVIDVTNPEPPPMAGEITTPGFAHAVATAEDLAYVAAPWDGLQIIDVADPQQPVLLGSVPCSGASAVAVTDSRVCFLDTDANQLCVVDGTNPAAPVLTGRVDLLGDLSAVAVTGTTACVAARAAGLQIVDVTDINAPVLVSSIAVMERAVNVVTQGHFAYVMSNYSMWNSGTLNVVDVTDPTVPVELGSISLGIGWCGLAVAGMHVYLVDEDMLYVINVTDPSAPAVVGELWGFSEASDIAVAGGFAYATDTRDGLIVVDVSEPTAPRRIQTMLNASGGFHIAVANNAVCVPDDDGLQLHWLQCSDLTTISAPPYATSGLRSYPNPFNPQTTIAYELPSAGCVRLLVFDMRGRLMRTLVDGALPAGRHEAQFDGRGDDGRELPSAVYLSRLEAGGKVAMGRMTLIR